MEDHEYIFKPERVDYHYSSKYYDGLDIVVNADSAKVYLDDYYVDVIGETEFFKLWPRHLPVLTIVMVDYEVSWDLESCYFNPFINYYTSPTGEKVLFYDLLTEQERLHFRSLGRLVLGFLLRHMQLHNNRINDQTPITVAVNDAKVDGSGNIDKLVHWYMSIGFEISEHGYQSISPAPQPTPMSSTFGRVILRTRF